MFNKLSFKIGLLFFVFILVIESFLFFILYTNLVNDRIDEVMNSLLARGNTHRDVLEDHFDQPTLEHVGIMESASEFIVIITNEKGEIIISSDPVKQEMINVVEHTNDEEIPTEGKIVEDRWSEGNYIVTDSPITISGEHKGHVFMFADTSYVKRTVDQLSNQFLIISFITVLLTIMTIFILSRFITQPLIKMKEETEQLSKGRHNIALHTKRKDELGELANSITKLSQELKELKQARNEFLASVSHELRTPLTYIKGYADIINRQGTSEEQVKEYVEIIREETEQLTVLIKNLFELAKIDQNNFRIRRERVNLCELIQRIIERIRPALAEKKILLHVNCLDEIKAYIDPERFQQVLINILDNAKKHSKEGSKILIEVKQTDQYIIITTTDDGEGIPAQDLPYIFDRLYRVEKSRSRQSGGTGLGLAISKEIIESHGGSIEAKSEIGLGTSIIIKLARGKRNE
ncbi:two-component sensor histidine kinase [Oceanobacillus oncorhynchi subsp. incaldanensis]|uniref:histidine kinase n=3 Tax=Oceanobacillus TaxID=182709 RepID=A0A0A1MCB0_9BACI|nr:MULTISPECIES: ATP-binding protein [Bacillaceae]MDM8100591.1 ATP-binding protein [Oceanobacillus oncorhynchi]GIO17611.1 two-component sensor histidine kinase [Oceanobacillus oncorhynchi subsp. incaldanensis]CEI82995.1 Alkaline phosphatase synthesis sensor protein PhoR [Oceanobacillus oncorhynchi]